MAKKLPGNINLNEAMMKNVNIIVWRRASRTKTST